MDIQVTSNLKYALTLIYLIIKFNFMLEKFGNGEKSELEAGE